MCIFLSSYFTIPIAVSIGKTDININKKIINNKCRVRKRERERLLFISNYVSKKVL